MDPKILITIGIEKTTTKSEISSAGLQTRLKQVFETFDSEMAKVVNHLGGTLADMRDVSESLGQGVVNLEEAMDSGTEALKDASTSLSALPKLEAPLLDLHGNMEGYQQVPGSLQDTSKDLNAIREAISRFQKKSI